MTTMRYKTDFLQTSRISECFSRLNQRMTRGLLAIEQQFRLLSGTKWARKCIHVCQFGRRDVDVGERVESKRWLILNQYAHSRRALGKAKRIAGRSDRKREMRK